MAKVSSAIECTGAHEATQTHCAKADRTRECWIGLRDLRKVNPGSDRVNQAPHP
jgi:hypothetical protein